MYPILVCRGRTHTQTDRHLFTHYSGISSHSQGSSYWKPHVSNSPALSVPKTSKAVTARKKRK
jgi:hypothetical protein